MPYTPDEILTIFYMNHSSHIKNMRESDHNTSEHLNPYHLEGDVWTHTMSVFNTAVAKNAPLEVLFAALLHDVGKPQCREIKFSAERGFYSRFSGHEGLSFYMAIDILQSYPRLSNEQVTVILELIASHSHLYNYSKKESPDIMYAGRQDFYDMLVTLVECDTLGRVSRSDIHSKSLAKLAELKRIKVASYASKEDKTMILMIGPPGSGKTTFTEYSGDDYHKLSRDEIVMELGEDSDYNKSWAKVNQREVDKVFTKRLNSLAKTGEKIIIDKCHMSKKSRREAISVARRYDYTVKCIIMARPISIILNRNEQRDKRIDPDIIMRMIKSFHFPTNEADYVYLAF